MKRVGFDLVCGHVFAVTLLKDSPQHNIDEVDLLDIKVPTHASGISSLICGLCWENNLHLLFAGDRQPR